MEIGKLFKIILASFSVLLELLNIYGNNWIREKLYKLIQYLCD